MRQSKTRTDWKRVDAITDKLIDFSDIPPLEVFDWSKADIVYPEGKTRTNIRLDTDVYRFFKSQGPGYQTRINAVLKSFMQHQLRPGQSRRSQKRKLK